MAGFIALLAIASGLAPCAASAQGTVPNSAYVPPPANAAISPNMDIPPSDAHGVVSGHKLQPEAAARPSQQAVRETLDGIDRLLKSDEDIAGRHSKVTIPHDLYGNDIGGNPGLEPIVDPALEK
jgi:hypothetical protein